MLRVCLKSVAFLLVLILLAITFERIRGEISLHRYLSKLAKASELNVDKLKPASVPIAEQAQLDILALTNQLNEFFGLSKLAPQQMKAVSPGIAAVSWRLEKWEDWNSNAVTWIEYGPKIKEAKPALKSLEKIWPKTGFDVGFDFEQGFLDSKGLPVLTFEKQLCVLLSGAISDDLHDRKLDEAIAHLHSQLKVVKLNEQVDLIIAQLVRSACGSYAFKSTWEELQAEGWNDDQLSQMSGWWNENDFVNPMVKSFKSERVMTLDYYKKVRANRSLALAQLDSAAISVFRESDIPTQGAVLRYIHFPLWSIAWSAQDELEGIRRWEPGVKIAETASQGSWKDVKPLISSPDLSSEMFFDFVSPSTNTNLYDRFRYLFSNTSLFTADKVMLHSMQMETEKNLIVTTIALKRYQLKYHELPATLSDLVPDYLAKVPIDPMDGNALRYRLNPNQTYMLYSVGEDGVDDGGDASAANISSKAPPSLWKGKDAVLPVAENSTGANAPN